MREVSDLSVYGQVETLEKEVSYNADTLALYHHLTEQGQRPFTLLLDSAEIGSKADLKSLMLLNSALRIACHGHQVTIEALTDNGKNLLPFLVKALVRKQAQCSLAETRLTAEFPAPESGIDEDNRLKAAGPMDVLRAIVAELSSSAGNPQAVFLGGAFAYDLIAAFEQLPAVADSANSCPDYLFYLAETLMLVDHQTQKAQLLGTVFGGTQAEAGYYQMARRLDQLSSQVGKFIAQPLPITPQPVDTDVSTTIDDETFCKQVATLKQHIKQGDIFQVVPSRTFEIACPDALLAYQHLKASNPSPYMFFLKDSEFALFGASPESALKYDADSNQVELYPIAGTRRRGFNPDGTIDPDLDSRFELELRLDKKELAEHIMLVDLARNDIARIAKPGTRSVAELLKVDRYSHVMHLVSRVVGQLREDLDALHAYQACMNMGTLVGAPKIRAAQLIRGVEQHRRGSYGGAVGYLNGNGDMDTCIVIRSAFVSQGKALVQAGAGVVHDSIPQAEADETRNKAAAVISAIQSANAAIQGA